MGEKSGGATRTTRTTRTTNTPEKNRRPARVFGYARVSSRDQNLARQVDALTAFGIDERSLFCDKASGKDFLRPSYQKLVRRMRPGDVLVVKSIDRLGRSYEDIIEEWRRLTKERGVRFGRPRIERPAVYARVRAGFEAGELSGGDAARACGVSRATFARWVQVDRAAERAGTAD